MPKRSCLAIVLAAGEGTRMRSALPKVMHKVGGLPMLGHVIAAAETAGATRLAVVVGPSAAPVREFVTGHSAEAAIYEQTERLGTGHAVLAAKKEFNADADDVIVLYGDTPLLTSRPLTRLRSALAKGADVVALGFRTANPTGYGRLVMEKGRLVAIREEKDADKAEREIDFCNAGVMAFRGSAAPLLKKIRNANAKGEYYLTDLVAIASKAGRTVIAIEGDESEFLGVNSRIELAAAERVFQHRARRAAMEGGVTLTAPETVWFSHDTKLARDVSVEPNVFFGPGVSVGEGATIRANSHIDGARIAAGATVGPFARLRPGADIGPNAHIGNFVEIKNAAIDEGAKVNHLTYVGDAHVGAAANVGAGTITCNYDGFDKHHTEIGAGAFIGSNSALVAPVTIGAGAYVASGSVVTMDVPDDAMAVARGRQVNKPRWAAKLKAHRQRGPRKPD
jgi:bifunctional UDP-N-acetylglucosamine pyrophosphorylase / glucosamine-1-phosphate N-acetyltransferase